MPFLLPFPIPCLPFFRYPFYPRFPLPFYHHFLYPFYPSFKYPFYPHSVPALIRATSTPAPVFSRALMYSALFPTSEYHTKRIN